MVNSITSKKKKKVVFLFGAGAEGKGQYGMPSGTTFKREVICAKQKIKEFVKSFNMSSDNDGVEVIDKINDGSLLSSRKYTSLSQTIRENIGKESDFDMNDFPKDLVESNKKAIKVIINYLNYKADDKGKNKKYRNAFYEVYKEEVFDKINKPNADKNTILEWFLDKACIYSDIDGLFNCLRKPNNYKTSTARLVKLYYSAFLTMVGKELFDSSNDNRLKFKEIMAKYYEMTINNAKNDTYYRSIKKYKDDNPNDSIKVITTNYTELAEREIGLKYKQKQNDDEIAYLHGRLNLFENVFTKEVKEITSFQDTDFIMPFIMVQSGVKPIVSPYQIKEFAKAIDFLENADIVVILGYGINSDDEHIQTMLRECTKNKDCYCFIHLDEGSNKEDFLKNETIAKNVLGDKCICKETSEFEVFLKEISKE